MLFSDEGSYIIYINIFIYKKSLNFKSTLLYQLLNPTLFPVVKCRPCHATTTLFVTTTHTIHTPSPIPILLLPIQYIPLPLPLYNYYPYNAYPFPYPYAIPTHCNPYPYPMQLLPLSHTPLLPPTPNTMQLLLPSPTTNPLLLLPCTH